MTTHDALLPATVLQRKAVVYVRQSTPQQVQSNLERSRAIYSGSKLSAKYSALTSHWSAWFLGLRAIMSPILGDPCRRSSAEIVTPSKFSPGS
jgi:hypothetical protein